MSFAPVEAARHLSFFEGSKTIQTFKDRKSDSDSLNRILESPSLETLEQLNEAGAGIFLMINQGNGRGRKKAHVVAIRAYYADFDYRQPPRAGEWPLEPSLLVESSPGRYHAYWLLTQPIVLSESIEIENDHFNRQQEAIALSVGAQPHDCKGLNRVMRLAGYKHQKSDQPFITRIVTPAIGHRHISYAQQEIKDAFPVAIVRTKAKAKSNTESKIKNKFTNNAFKNQIASIINSRIGERNNTFNRAAFICGLMVRDGKLDIETAKTSLLDAGGACQLNGEEVAGMIRRSIQSGIDAPLNTTDQKPEENKEEKTSASMQLLAYIQNDGAEYWHSGSNCYLTVQVNGHAEHMPLPSYAAKQYSKALFYNTSKKIISDQNIKETLGLLEALARENKQQYEVAIRSCHIGEASYIDLGQPDWSVVQVTADAWDLISSQECPVRFLRPGGMLPLPTPVRGGHLRDLKQLLNVNERGLVLTTAWLLAALAGLPPFPLLALAGEQGTGKSTAGSVLRRLVDPHQADRRRAPQSERDLFVAAQNTYVLSFENLSSIPDWMSDALCAFSTGGTFTARRLYSDNEEVFLNAVRPVIVNGIPDLVSRPDLADRALVVHLERLDQKNRLTERAFWAQFDALQPQLLGALCDTLVMGLAHMDSVTLDVQPRMLDFAKLVIAAEPALPWPPGTFLREFLRMRSEAVSSILDGNVVAAALLRWADDHTDWTGTLGEFLRGLTATTYQDRRPPTAWPTSARQLGSELRRLAPALREQGYEITSFGRGTGGAYQYNFRRTFTTYTADANPEMKFVEIDASRPDSVAAVDSEGHER